MSAVLDLMAAEMFWSMARMKEDAGKADEDGDRSTWTML